MPCGCNGGNNSGQGQEPLFVVTLPTGMKVEVRGEHAARVEVTKAGGGSYAMK